MQNYQEPIIKIIMLQPADICTLSQEEEDPWGDPNWKND